MPSEAPDDTMPPGDDSLVVLSEAVAPELPEGAAPGKALPAPALRALEEAAERRKADAAERDAAELGGPKGPEPTRYGDWERKGLAVDF